MNSFLKYGVWVVLGAWVPTQATLHAAEMPWSRKINYSIYIPRSSQYEVAPGDLVEVGVTTGYQGSREKIVVAKQVQVVKISETGQTAAMLNLAMSKKEVKAMRQAMLGLQPNVYVKVVQRQIRKQVDASPTHDGIPELDFDIEDSVARNPQAADPTH